MAAGLMSIPYWRRLSNCNERPPITDSPGGGEQSEPFPDPPDNTQILEELRWSIDMGQGDFSCCWCGAIIEAYGRN